MPVEQTPIHRPASPETAHKESEYAAVAQAQFRILKDYMVMARLNVATRVVDLGNGVIITCRKCFSREDIFITAGNPVTGKVSEVVVHFLHRPRAATLKEYHTKDYQWVQNLTPQREPTRRGDRPNRWNEQPHEQWSNAPAGVAYGNIEWRGAETRTDDKDAPILSWCGPPSRYFPIENETTYYPGVSTFDDTVTVENMPVDRYTCFGPWVFNSGRVVYTAPALGCNDPKVVGAAYIRMTLHGKVSEQLVTILNVNYKDTVNPIPQVGNTENKGGFFYEVWIEGKRQGYFQWERAKVPFFFNPTGTQAKTIQGRYELTINISGTPFDNKPTVYTVNFTQTQLPMIERQESYTEAEDVVDTTPGEVPYPNTVPAPPGWGGAKKEVTRTKQLNMTRAGSYKVAVDYKADGSLVYATASVSSSKITKFKDYGLVSFDTAQFRLAGDEPPPYSAWISHINIPHAGCYELVEITPGECAIESISWSWNGGEFEAGTQCPDYTAAAAVASCGPEDIFLDTTITANITFVGGTTAQITGGGGTIKTTDASKRHPVRRVSPMNQLPANVCPPDGNNRVCCSFVSDWEAGSSRTVWTYGANGTVTEEYQRLIAFPGHANSFCCEGGSQPGGCTLDGYFTVWTATTTLEC